MFDNPGEKLKIGSVILFILEALGVVAYYISLYEKNGYVVILLLVFLAISYFSCLCMYGFGELLNNTASTNAKTKEIEKRIKEIQVQQFKESDSEK